MGAERIEMIKEAAAKVVGRTIQSAEVGEVTSAMAKKRGETMMGGDGEYVEFRFSDGTTLRLETRSSWRGDGSFLVTR